ncbi:hypothetical protein E1B28_007621 [Marasmius oreades]|uniref:DRMBL-domain-containing protein n=1 Tax=Marasmius oreades TaxID=181124 RepID=A0A9P7UV53_9AGAR|nr:uncharacterized protein E1B28_007621 [Marasmius oreades]KAG7093991.1 hypothetical protein E1B28_007621 [Marasmius oreades]
MAKKKAPSPQSNTLLTWFGHATSTPGQPTLSSQKPTPSKPKRRKTSNLDSIPPDPEDIIIIPSDSDEGIGPVCVTKKRRTSNQYASVESGYGLHSVRQKPKKTTTDASMMDGCMFTSTVTASGAFGPPDESILPSTRPLINTVPPGPVVFSLTGEDTSFGSPSELLGATATHVTNLPTNPEAGPSKSVQECSSDKGMYDSRIDDDWVMGDDERMEDDDEDEDTDEIEFLEEPQVNSPSILESALKSNLRPLTSLVAPHPCASATSSRKDAYSVLMASHKENEAWKEADSMEDRSLKPFKTQKGDRRKAPFYKVLQGMPIAVDAFRYGSIPGVNAYFLTHAHSDHYTNLSSSWKTGPIYCSEGTANLIKHMLKVDPKWVHPLPMDAPSVIPNTGGVQVTLIEANHCPGSCLFFFEGKQTVNAGDSNYKSAFVGSDRTFRYLHCGDFRASPRHVFHPAVRGKRIDHVYLDTTYLDPRYTFPPQPLVISACAELAKRIAENRPLNDPKSTSAMSNWLSSSSSSGLREKEKGIEAKANILMVVGTYSIGKERIVKAIAKALDSKVYCDSRKAAILRCQADLELDNLLTSNPLAANVHLVPLGFISSDKLEPYLNKFKGHFTRVVGFRPTGWTYSPPAGEQAPTVRSVIARVQHNNYTYVDLHPSRNSTSKFQVYPVPYSEHSSFSELTCFALSFEWTKMIATVNVGSETSRVKMTCWMSKWEAERKQQGNNYTVPNRHTDYW